MGSGQVSERVSVALLEKEEKQRQDMTKGQNHGIGGLAPTCSIPQCDIMMLPTWHLNRDAKGSPLTLLFDAPGVSLFHAMGMMPTACRTSRQNYWLQGRNITI